MLTLFDRGIVPIEDIVVARRYGYVDETDRAAAWRLKSFRNRARPLKVHSIALFQSRSRFYR